MAREIIRRRAGQRFGHALLIGMLAVMLAASGGYAALAADEGPPPGATVEALLEMARQLSPELAARTLEKDAAAARIDAAGALEDPMLRVTSDEDRDEHGGRINKMIYGIEQEIPLWGKRDLKRRIATAEADGAAARVQEAALELEARVTTAFAAYYRASRTLQIQDELHALLHTVAQAAEGRYAQGLGSQSDAIRAAVERSRLALVRETLQRDRRMAAARLNALLARAAGAPLAEPEAVRSLPPPEALALEPLLEQARQRSPLLAGAQAEITAAEGGRQLVRKSWYPDLSLGAAAIQREDGPEGYMLMAGVRLPLQWGLRDAQAREASATLAAARSRREAAVFELQGALEEALARLEAARRTAALLTEDLTPQATAAYASSLTAYQLGRGDLTAVLEAAHHVRDVEIERLTAEEEAQGALAEIERLTGGGL